MGVELRAIFADKPTTASKLNALMADGSLGFAHLEDPDLCLLLRKLLRAGYWADQPEVMAEITMDLNLAEHPSAAEAMSLIRELEVSTELSGTLQHVGQRVGADSGLREVFDALKARGHEFDF